jgi:lipopolysaccharide transport system ATP-binding protein
VAAHLEPEILIIDEVLAVGDAEFQKKCLGKMKDVANEGRTVLFVSHNMGSVQLLCNKGIVIENGKISFFGDVNNALDKYNSKSQENETFFNTVDYSKRKRGQKLLTISSIELDNSIYYPDSSFSIKVKIQKNDDEFRGKIDIAVFIFDELQNTVFHLGTLFEEMDLYFDNSSYYEFTIPLLSLNSGNYSIAVWLSGNGIEQDYVDQNIFFEVENGSIYPNKNANIVSMIQKEFNFLIHQRSL